MTGAAPAASDKVTLTRAELDAMLAAREAKGAAGGPTPGAASDIGLPSPD